MSAAPAAPAELPEQAAAEPSIPASSAPSEELSTAILSARIAAQLRGETTPKPAPEPGPEPSPGQDASSSTPQSSELPPASPAEPEPTDPKGLPKEAVAALSHLRSEKRELKAQLQSKSDELAAFQDRLEALEQQIKKTAEPIPAPAPTELASALSSPELDAARKEESARKQDLHKLTKWIRVLNQTQDPAPILAEIRADGIQIPDLDAESLANRLEAAREISNETFDEAKATRRRLTEKLQSEAESIRQASDRLASQWVPEMQDAKTDRAKMAAEVFQHIPVLRQHPKGNAFVALAVRGLELVMQEDAAAKAKTNGHVKVNGTGPTLPRTRLPGAPAALPQRPAEGEISSSKLFERFQQTGKPEDKEAWMKAVMAGR